MNIEDVIAAAIVIAGVGALLAIWCAVVSWAIRDANKRGKTGCFMLVLFWLFGPLAVIVWLMIRPTQLTHRRPDSYATPDDALAAASRMDMLGDWDAAIALYEFVGRHCPEHRDYAAASVQKIKEKQALA